MMYRNYYGNQMHLMIQNIFEYLLSRYNRDSGIRIVVEVGAMTVEIAPAYYLLCSDRLDASSPNTLSETSQVSMISGDGDTRDSACSIGKRRRLG